MVDANQLSLKDYHKVRRSIDVYKLNTAEVPHLSALDNEWIYGVPGVGKSKMVRD